MNSYLNQDNQNQPNQIPPAQAADSNQYPPYAPPGYSNQYPYRQDNNPQGGYSPGTYQQGGYQQQQAGYELPYGIPYQQPLLNQQGQGYNTGISLDWRFLTAGIGSLVAIIAFFLPSYNPLGTLRSIIGTSLSYYNYYSFSGAQMGRQLWLDFIIAIIVLLIVVGLQFGSRIIRNPTSPITKKVLNSLTTQQKNWGLGLFLLGVFGIFFHFVLDLGVLNIWLFGAWLYTLGIVAVAVGGYFTWRPMPKATTPAAPFPTNN
jgi:hypothetical protein